MDSAVRIASRIRRLLHQSVDDLIVAKKISDSMRETCGRMECAGVRIISANGDRLANHVHMAHRLIGSFGILALDEDTDELIGYIWATDLMRSQEGVQPFFYDIDPKPGSVYIYDLFIQPAYRKLGLATVLMRLISQEAGRRGYTSVFYTIDSGNKAMVALSANLGFQVVGALQYRSTLGITRRNTTDLGVVCVSK